MQDGKLCRYVRQRTELCAPRAYVVHVLSATIRSCWFGGTQYYQLLTPQFFTCKGITMNHCLLISTLLAALSLSACEKPTVVNVPAAPAAVPGPAGPTGAAGDQGVQGNTGRQGNEGNKGETGNQGTQGAQGETGNQGNQGETGNQGNQGNQGETGKSGDNTTNSALPPATPVN
jgi:hypothetical protein